MLITKLGPFTACLFLLSCLGITPLAAQALHLTLEQAVAQALEANRQLLLAENQVNEAVISAYEAGKEFSWTIQPTAQMGYAGGGDAGEGPTVGGGFSASRRLKTGTQLTLTPNLSRVNDTYTSNARARVTQPLLRGAGARATLAKVHSAQYAQKSKEWSFLITQTQIVLRTIRAVYEVVKQQHLLELHQCSLHRIDGVHEVTSVKERLGLTERADLLRVQSDQQKERDALKAAEQGYARAHETLRELLALPIGVQLVVEAPIDPDPVVTDVDEALETALAHRIELVQSCGNLSEQQRQLRLARQKRLPQLDLVVEYSNCGSGQELVYSCIRDRVNRWDVGLKTSADLTPTAVQCAIRKQQLALDRAREEIEKTRDTIVVEVRKSLGQLERAAERMTLETSQIKNAKGRLHLAQLQFKRGMINNADVLGTERALRKAHQKHLDAQIDHIVEEYQLLAAMGVLLLDEECE